MLAPEAKMERIWLALGAANAFVAVVTGAWAAHGLKARLGPDLLAVFETGSRYQMYHALGLLALGLFAAQRSSALVSAAGISMLVGILVFSGSLYTLALSGVRWLGAITPFGGVAFLVGWVLFFLAALKR